MTEQSPRPSQTALLQSMTSAMKLFKLILHQLESEYRTFHYENTIKDLNIEERIGELGKIVGAIEGAQCKKMLSTRLVNRFIEIVILYRNKFSECDATLGLRDHLCTIFAMIKQYQTASHIGTNASHYIGQGGLYLTSLFDKICRIFTNCVRQLKQKYQKANYISLDVPTHNSKTVQPAQLQTYPSKQKQRDRRSSFPDTSCIKSLQYKYRVTKEVIGNVSLFAGMDIDVSHLRGLYIQASSNFAYIHEDKLDSNHVAIRCRDEFLQAYTQWKMKVRRKASKKEKMANASLISPNKTAKNSENKSITFVENKNNNPLTKTLTKMPKITQATQYNNSMYQEQDKKRKQFKNMQALTFNRQFIHLSEIKNQKIARRPYAEVKQVLVAGDELSYYSQKNGEIVGLGQQNGSSKVSFFMQRAVKNQKVIIRKKSFNENSRLATEQ